MIVHNCRGRARPVSTTRCTIIGGRKAPHAGWNSHRSRNSSASNPVLAGTTWRAPRSTYAGIYSPEPCDISAACTKLQSSLGAEAAVTVIYRPVIREARRRLVQQREQVHRAVHCDVSAKSDRYLVELQPPSTTMVCPLTKLPPGEHKNATVPAMSSTVPNRWCGVISMFIRRNRS